MFVPLLSHILWTPFLGMLILIGTGARSFRAHFGIALATSTATFVLSLWLALGFEHKGGIQFAETHPWAPEIGMSYSLGVDGLSLSMLLLTTGMCAVAILACTISPIHGSRGFLAWMLLLEFGLIGVFLSTDWFLFYMFWELTLIPMFFLIGIWGGPGRHTASLTFFLYTLAGSIPMLIALLVAYIATPGHTFSMAAMAERSSSWSQPFQLAVMIGLLIGFAVKIPMVPLHGWLPLAHVEAPVPASVMLSAVLLKMGAYGIMRAGELVPAGLSSLADLLLVAGLFNIVYGAVLASRQTNLKAMVAWSSISHMGFVLLGISAFNLEGYIGASMQMLTHGLISALLFLCAGFLYERTHTQKLAELTGAGHAFPGGLSLITVAFLANMSLPGLAGFVSELHALVGALDRHGLIVLLASGGVVLTGAWNLRSLSTLGCDSRRDPLPGLTITEKTAAVPLAILIVVLGLFPELVLGPSSPALRSLLARFP